MFIPLMLGLTSKGQVYDTLYLNRGEMMTVDSLNTPYLAFNRDTAFDQTNHQIHLNTGDSLYLTIINNDSVGHEFDIKYILPNPVSLGIGSTQTLSLHFPEDGAFIYYDKSDYPNFRYMGLAGMISVEDHGAATSSFFWNIKEHDPSLNSMLSSGGNPDWSTFYPSYFTINGMSNPHINEDTVARVTGSVGDTILIYMVNTGQAVHSMHFHGYHGEITYSGKFPNHEGRSKDTFPVYSMEAVVIKIVPDQPGEYPVHDHNLVAVSGGKLYPNGMFVTLLIQ